MYSLNKVQLIGNLTRDPEVRQIPSGQMVCTIGIATNRTWKDQQGQKQEDTQFHNVVLWGRLAEIAGQYMKKGQKIYIEGRLQTRSWDNDQGVKQYRTEIVCENMIMLSPRGGGAGSDQEFSGGVRQGAPSQDFAPAEEKISVEDLPF